MNGTVTSQGYKAEFVGPWTGTHGFPDRAPPPDPPPFPGESSPEAQTVKGGYADGVPGAFAAMGHAAKWGRQAKQTRETIQEWVSTYQPDYLLVLLGFNDLGWFVSGPVGLIGDMGWLVQNARNGKSNVKIVVGNVVHRTAIGGREDLIINTDVYNKMLADTLPSWWRDESPISYVDVASKYDCAPGGCPDGYDGLHPAGRGEVHIAQAFAASLKKDFGFQGGDLGEPATGLGRSVAVPLGIGIQVLPSGLHTYWDRDMNARGYELRSKLDGMADWWSSGVVYPNAASSWFQWATKGQTWVFQPRAKGDNDDRSLWGTAGFATANPQTVDGPDNIVVSPTGSGMTVTWDPVSGASVNRYGVIIWDQDTEGSYINQFGVAGNAITIPNLLAGHRYAVWVATWVNLGDGPAAGLPAAARHVIIGGVAPGGISGLTATNIDPTTVQLSWNAAPNAAGYAVYWRSLLDGASGTASLDQITLSTSAQVGFLFPGTWHSEFCIAAYNGNMESVRQCVIPPVYPGYETRRLRRDSPGRKYNNETVKGEEGLKELWEVGQRIDAQRMGVMPTVPPEGPSLF